MRNGGENKENEEKQVANVIVYSPNFPSLM